MLVVGSTLVMLTGCQTPSWMQWGKKPDNTVPLASSSTPKALPANATVTRPSVAASSPAPAYGAPAATTPAATSSNPYSNAMAGGSAPAAGSAYGSPSASPYAQQSAYSTPSYPNSGYAAPTAYPSTATPSAVTANNSGAAAPSGMPTSQPQTGYYGSYPGATAGPTTINNSYATSPAVTAPSASTAPASRYNAADDVLGPRPNAASSQVAAAPAAQTVPTQAAPVQSWNSSPATGDYGSGMAARPTSDPLAVQSSSTASNTSLSPGCSVPRSDVGQTGYTPPSGPGYVQVATNPPSSYHPGSVHAPATTNWPPASGNDTNSGGLAPAPTAASPAPYSSNYPTTATPSGSYPPASAGGYAPAGTSSYNQVPAYNPSATGTGYNPPAAGYPGVGISGSAAAGASMVR